MKKIYVLMALAAMMFVACNPDDKPAKDKDKGKGGEEQKEYVAPITIDGNFDDWAKIDASKMAIATCAENTGKKDLKTLKVYADEMFIFIYVEYNLSDYDPADITTTNLDVHINGDNDVLTGGWNGQWNQGDTPCIDMMCQGEVFDADGNVVDYEPGMFKYGAAPNTSEWAWEDVTVEGFIIGKGTKKAIEISLTRDLYPLGAIADTFTIGLEILVNGWDATGALPNQEMTEDDPSGQAPLLTVTTNK